MCILVSQSVGFTKGVFNWLCWINAHDISYQIELSSLTEEAGNFA